jgi:hypothetical protein
MAKDAVATPRFALWIVAATDRPHGDPVVVAGVSMMWR